jgi:hypothetical protein
MEHAQKEEFLHFAMDLEFLARGRRSAGAATEVGRGERGPLLEQRGGSIEARRDGRAYEDVGVRPTGTVPVAGRLSVHVRRSAEMESQPVHPGLNWATGCG